MPTSKKIKNWLWLILTVAALYLAVLPVSANVLAEKQALLIGFQTFPGAAEHQLLRELGGKVTREFSMIPVVKVELPANAVTALTRNPLVKYVESDTEVYAVSQRVPWGIAHIMAPEAWKQSTGNGINVAVLDTGIGLHSDLPVVYMATNTIDNSGNFDANGHGTHVAGTIGALKNQVGVVGTAPQIGLYSVKVLADNGTGTASSVAAGIEWAVSQGANIINMSFGSSAGSKTIESACIAAYEHGVLLVAAAGNSGNSNGLGDNVSYPAKYPAVIAVAASNSYNQRADFSSTGSAVELTAPGVDILSTSMPETYTYASGTSVASPHVAGVAALVWSINPNLTNVQVRGILQQTAKDLQLSSTFQGFGLVQADLAVAATQDGTIDSDETNTREDTGENNPIVRTSTVSNFIHEIFGTNTNSCRSCHIFHDAPAQKLLKTGPSQTQFCYLCHGNGAPSSPYDVQGGTISGASLSSAGGFDSMGAVPVTSRHMVDGYLDNTSAFVAGSNAVGFSGVIPGSSNKTLVADLVCSSCHNPHAGGPDALNPRLLRTVIMEVYDLFVIVDAQPVGTPDLSTGYQASQIIGYESGFNKWCSSCHDLLARATGSGHIVDQAGYFWHATNVTAAVYAPYNTTIGPGIPLEAANTEGDDSVGLVTCMTCHRSHATVAQMTPGGFAEDTLSSFLLRMDNRGVCVACHGDMHSRPE